jgi:CHAD domain-containing protein
MALDTVGTLAGQAVKTYLEKAESYEKAVLKDRDPENLHQMRVNFRRLRTVMQVFAPSIDLPKAGQESQVATIARILGSLRDLDVITEILQKQYLPDLPETERQGMVEIFNYLAAKRRKAYKRVKATLKGDRYDALKTSLHAWVADPVGNDTTQLNIYRVLPDLTLPLVSHLWLHPGWLVGTKQTQGNFKPNTRLSRQRVDDLVGDHSSALHSLRKQVKRVRYQLRFVADYYGDRLQADLNRLSDLQDVLGALQDSLVMAAILPKALPNWEAELPTLKALLADSRHRAWKQWQTLQQSYLSPENREALRHILMQPGTVAPEAAATKAPATKRTKSGTRRSKSQATGKSTKPRRQSTPTKGRKSSSQTPKKSSSDANHNGTS